MENQDSNPIKRIAVVVGSLRRGSINRKLSGALVKLAPDGLDFEFLDVGSLPHYNQDLEEDVPAVVAAFRQKIKAADGFMFVVPEYNRGAPGMVKNALDWGSRPMGESGWIGKPALLAGASGGAISTAAMQVHLRAILSSMGIHAMGHPEVYIQFKKDLIDDESNVTVEGTEKFLTTVMERFGEWVGRF